MTTKEHWAVNPAASLAVYVTVVVPTGNGLPGGVETVTVGVPESSVAVGAVQKTAAVVAGGITVPDADCGQLKSCGGWFVLPAL